jgi:uracil-DNA glycosylase
MGNPHSPYLLVGDFPGYHESIAGLPFAFRKKATETRSGDILKDELTRVGIMMNTVLVTNLWQHQKDDKECDLNLHLDQLVALFKDRTHVLLMGSEVTQALLGEKIGAVSGLQVKVPGFSKVHFWASPNPALAYSQPIGELRLAFTRFSEDVNKKRK